MSASEESGYEQIQLDFTSLNSLTEDNAEYVSEMVIKLLINSDYTELFLSDLADIAERSR
jgi:hypothetical protein